MSTLKISDNSAICKAEKPATRPYRPGNGFEGSIFDDNWCSRCQHDAAWREDPSEFACDILSRTLLYNIDNLEYPTEWVEDDVPYSQDTQPRCAAFLPIGDASSSYVEDERQGELCV
jgi:hypothetical protein